MSSSPGPIDNRPQVDNLPHIFEDASGFQGEADRLFIPENDAEVAAILVDASAAGIPVTIAGAGTGLTGGRVAQGGWALSLEKFHRLEIDHGHAIAGAGVSLQEVQAAAAQTRQFYPPDPTERTASVGGSIATNASGSRSFRYGDTRRWINGLKVAFIDGRVAEYRRGDAIDFAVPEIPAPRTTKNTAGYPLRPGMDWVDLFAGSEGTLGVILEADLGLLPAPEELLSGVIFFRADDEALDAVDSWRGIEALRMIEYFDRNSLVFLRERYSEVPQSAAAAVLIEQVGDDTEPWEAYVEGESWFALAPADRERFRAFRHALPEMVNDLMRRRGFLKLGSDYAVPIDRNREMLRFYHDRLAEASLDYVIFGHIGDAHVHVNILPNSPAQFESGKQVMLDFARQAVLLGGTVSAEHGLGKRKSHLLPLQFTPEEIESMKAVKRRLDPRWLLGRGNVFGASPTR
jgi:FAD/FMN-containing dehydrogenase